MDSHEFDSTNISIGFVDEYLNGDRNSDVATDEPLTHSAVNAAYRSLTGELSEKWAEWTPEGKESRTHSLQDERGINEQTISFASPHITYEAFGKQCQLRVVSRHLVRAPSLAAKLVVELQTPLSQEFIPLAELGADQLVVRNAALGSASDTRANRVEDLADMIYLFDMIRAGESVLKRE